MAGYIGDVNIRVNADLNTKDMERALKDFTPTIEIEPKADKLKKSLENELTKAFAKVKNLKDEFDNSTFKADKTNYNFSQFFDTFNSSQIYGKGNKDKIQNRLNYYIKKANEMHDVAQRLSNSKLEFDTSLSSLGLSYSDIGLSEDQQQWLKSVEKSYETAAQKAHKVINGVISRYNKEHPDDSLQINPLNANFGDVSKLYTTSLQTSIKTAFKRINATGLDPSKLSTKDIDLQTKRLSDVIPLMQTLNKFSKKDMVKYRFDGDTDKSVVTIARVKELLKDFEYYWKEATVSQKEQVKDKQLSKSEEKEVSNEVYVEQLEKRVSELKQENLKLENDKKRFAAKKEDTGGGKSSDDYKSLKTENEKLKKENSELSEFMVNMQDKQQDSDNDSGNGGSSEGNEVSEGGVSLSRFEAIKGLLKSRDISLNNKKKQVEALNKKIKELEAKSKTSGKTTLKGSDDNIGITGASDGDSGGKTDEESAKLKANFEALKRQYEKSKSDYENNKKLSEELRGLIDKAEQSQQGGSGNISKEALERFKTEIEKVCSSIKIGEFDYTEALEKLRQALKNETVDINVGNLKTASKPTADSASSPQKRVTRKPSAKSDKSDNSTEDDQYWKEKFKANIEERTSEQSPQELKDYFKAVSQISQEIDKSMKSINSTADSLIKKSGTKSQQSQSKNLGLSSEYSAIQSQAASIQEQIESIKQELLNPDADTNSITFFKNIDEQVKELYADLEVIQDQYNDTTKKFDELNNAYKTDTAAQRIKKKASTLLNQYVSFKDINSNAFKQNDALSAQWDEWYNKLKNPDLLDAKEIDKADAKLKEMRATVKDLGIGGKTAGELISNMFKKYGGWAIVTRSMVYVKSVLRDIYQATKDVDTSMVNLKKVSNETAASYDAFLTNAAKKSKELGVSISDLVDSTSEFSRLGYNLKDATKLGELATMYSNVAEDLSVTDAASSIISTMKAYDIAADDAQEIVDKFNYVGNNFAISSTGLGDSLQRSASALVAAGNSLDETIALTTAGNAIVQDPEKMGTVLKTASARLRGATAELEEMGEETDDVANGTAKLRQEILALSGVDIMKNDNTFKGTYQILDEISKVYDSLSDVNQAALLEQIGGKNGINVIAAVLSNFDEAREVMSTIGGSRGSASEEMEKSLDSITGKLGKLSAIFQDISTKALESDTVKSFLDILIGIGNAISKLIPSLNTVLKIGGAIGAGALGAKGINIGAGEPIKHRVPLSMPASIMVIP